MCGSLGYAFELPLQNYIKRAPSGQRQLLATESPLKMMKNTFYILYKSSFSFSRCLNFVLTFCSYRKTATHILPNILKSKDNQTMKFGQLIEYNMRNIFLEYLSAKCVGESSPKPFPKKS